MTIERAIEILNPEHREHYDSIEIVEEACRMGMNALEKQIPKKPTEYDSVPHARCPHCTIGVRVYCDSAKVPFCQWCGQALDWGDNDD